MTVVKYIYGNNKPLLSKNSLRTIEAQFFKNLRITRLGRNLLVLIKKSVQLKVSIWSTKYAIFSQFVIYKSVDECNLNVKSQHTHPNRIGICAGGVFAHSLAGLSIFIQL